MVKIRFIFLKHNVVIVTRLPVQPQPKALWGVEKDTIKDGGLKTRVCVFSCVESACVESLSGVQTLALRIAKIILSSGMASKSIPPMDITGSKSELSERWRVWLRGFTYAEGKANLHTERREKQKRTTLSSCFRGTGHFRESGSRSSSKRPRRLRRLSANRTLNAYYQVQENPAKGMFFTSHAKNPEKMSTHLCFDFANKQGIVAIGKRNLNSP